MFVAMPVDGFKYTAEPAEAVHAQGPRTRGDARILRRMRHPYGDAGPRPAGVVLKVGTLDDPAQINPQMAIYTVDKQPFHHIPEGMPSFERLPQR